MNEFGKALKKFRKEKGITGYEMSIMLGCSQATVSSWERGKTYPSIDLVARLVVQYQFELDQVLADMAKDLENIGFDSHLAQAQEEVDEAESELKALKDSGSTDYDEVVKVHNRLSAAKNDLKKIKAIINKKSGAEEDDDGEEDIPFD